MPEDLPEIQDANEDDGVADPGLAEDDPQLLDATSRSLEGEVVNGEEQGLSERHTEIAQRDDAGDTDSIPVAPHPSEQNGAVTSDWACELSAHRIAVELRHIELEVRKLLEGRDPRRKRRLNGTRRWHELEEDIIGWRYSMRFEESTLKRLGELINQRHFLFRRLTFLAGTRPTWNT